MLTRCGTFSNPGISFGSRIALRPDDPQFIGGSPTDPCNGLTEYIRYAVDLKEAYRTRATQNLREAVARLAPRWRRPAPALPRGCWPGRLPNELLDDEITKVQAQVIAQAKAKDSMIRAFPAAAS